MATATKKKETPDSGGLGGHSAWTSKIVGHDRVDPHSLIANPLNFRKHPQAQRDALRDAIAEVGFIRSVTVNKRTGNLIDGHERVWQALTSEQPFIDVEYVDLSEEDEKKALATMDPISEMAEVDGAALELLLKDVQTGSEALQQMLSDLAIDSGLLEQANAEIIEDEAPKPPADPITKPGDIWILGEHRLMCGDSTKAEDVALLMNGERAACVFTSPPYAVGVDYGIYQDTLDNLRAMLPKLAVEWMRIVEPGGFAVVNFGDVAAASKIVGVDEPCEYPMALEYWPVFRAAGWLLHSRRVWCKPNPRVNSLQCISSNRAATDWENVWTWKAPGRALIGRVDGTMRSCQGWCDTTSMQGVDLGKEVHGAGMSVGIAAWMLNVHSENGGIIHEPFCGTGTTIIAAEQLHRRCYAMEISPAYCDVAVARWEKLTGKKAERSN